MSKFHFDKKSKHLPKIISGNDVMARTIPNSNEWQKARVENEQKPNSYWIRTENDNIYRRSRVDMKLIPVSTRNAVGSATTLNTSFEPVPSQSPATAIPTNHGNSENFPAVLLLQPSATSVELQNQA